MRVACTRTFPLIARGKSVYTGLVPVVKIRHMCNEICDDIKTYTTKSTRGWVWLLCSYSHTFGTYLFPQSKTT